MELHLTPNARLRTGIKPSL